MTEHTIVGQWVRTKGKAEWKESKKTGTNAK